jgi:oxygen-independent coproporphyrinogen-3 oxidase
VNSIYFGGGTPSILRPKKINNFITQIQTLFDLSPKAEITMEANPDDLSPDYLAAIKEAGINRLSIGIQSFNDSDLRFMNRSHDAQTGINAVEQAFNCGIENISIDLIYGIPETNNFSWEENLEKAASLPVNHLSCYALTVEQQTPLAKSIKLGKSPAPDESQAAEQFALLQRKAPELGFEHYEVSNLCRNGARAVHNSAYWSGKPYLGIGPSAHSFTGKQRRMNVANNMKYSQGLRQDDCPHEIELINPRTRYHELVLTGIRTSRGMQIRDIKETEEIYFDYFNKTLKKHQSKFNISNDAASLKPEFWIYAERIALDFFIE